MAKKRPRLEKVYAVNKDTIMLGVDAFLYQNPLTRGLLSGKDIQFQESLSGELQKEGTDKWWIPSGKRKSKED